MSPHLADPPHRRARLPPVVTLGGEPAKRLAQRLPQREERYRLADCVSGADGEGKPESGRRADGVAQERGLSNARFPLNEQHAADPALRAEQQLADQPLLCLASVHGVHAIHDTRSLALKQGKCDSINSWDS
jgi:hypothetical protein